jgi:hypothetical protein
MLSGSRPVTLDLSFDLGETTRTPEFFATARASRINAPASSKTLIGCTPKSRKNFAVQAAVLLFGTFF